MVDGLGGLWTAFQAARDVGKNDKGGGDPEAGGPPTGGGGKGGAGGTFESDIFGGSTYTTESGQVYHGQEAIDMYQQDHGGPPTDGITGESGLYYGEGSWKPSSGGGQPGGGQPQGGAWGGGRGFGK